MTRAQDWLIYLKDPDAFEMDHFSQSLVDNSPEYSIDVDLFFSFTQHKNQVIERINKLKSQTYFNGLYYLPKSSEAISESKAKNLLWKCIQVSADHSRMKGNESEADALTRTNLTTTNGIDKFHQLGIDRFDEQNLSFK
jgi:hypothetical protein